MKFKLSALLLAAIISGCSFKSTPINLGSPDLIYKGASTSGSTINLQSVSNSNPTGNIVVIVKDSKGNVISEIPTTQSLSDWYNSAIRAQFSMAGINFSNDSSNSVAIKLTKVELVYISDTLNTKNLNIKVVAEMKLSDRKGSVTREYNLEDNKYSATINDSAELTPYLKDLLSKLTAKMTKDTVNFVNGN